jgi:hypothetical protein
MMTLTTRRQPAHRARQARMERCARRARMSPASVLIAGAVYLIFAFWDVFETVMVYLFVVETKGLSLEQIEDVFAQPKPVAYSLRRVEAVASDA